MIIDVVVIGGGPAGTTAATALARAGAAVVVLERSHYDTDRIGETLARTAAVRLGEIGVNLATVPHLKSTGTIVLWDKSVPTATDPLFAPDGDGWHVDRRALDATLAQSAALAGAAVHTGVRVTSCHRAGDRWRVRISDREYVARWVIDATAGRECVGDRPRRLDRQVALAARLTGVNHHDARLAVEAVQDGWWYYAPLPCHRGVAVYLTDVDLIPDSAADRMDFWHRGIAATALISPRVDRATVTTVSLVRAGMCVATAAIGDGWLAVGDSALKPDPLSGLGITLALNSGWFGGIAVRNALSGDLSGIARYGQEIDYATERFLSERATIYSRVRHWPNSAFWGRRSLSSGLAWSDQRQ